ncbi:MAG TPA: glycosyl hydrolase [Solirubrobacterales bacterium]
MAEALPGNFWGVVPQTRLSADQYARLKQGGVDSVRIPILWESIQPTKDGAPVWSGVDELVGAAASAGIDVFPFLYGAPSWAVVPVPVPGSGGAVRAPKTLPVHTGVQRAGWQRFLKLAVWRYGPQGSFWLEHPAIPRRPIRTWQIWNEENFKYFVVRPNPAEYGQLVKLSYTALKGADPGAKLVLGGLFAHPIEATRKRRPPQAYFAGDYLEQMYRSTPGIKSKFNGIALHPYTGSYQRLTPYIEEVRAVLAANHDAGKGIWITELGWSSSPPRRGNSFAKGIGGQRQQLQGALGLLKQQQRKWRVQRVYWFSVDDLPGSCNFCDGSGLFGAGFVPKPAWYSFVRFAGGRPG